MATSAAPVAASCSSGDSFIVFGDDWGRHVSTTQHVFRVIARDHRVFWLNAINHRTPRLSVYDVRRAAGKLRDMLNPRLQTARELPVLAGAEADDVQLAGLVPPRILPWHDVRLIRHFNTRSVLRDVRAALVRSGQQRRPILVSATPAIPDVVRQLDAVVKIYFCLDDYGELPGVDKDLVLPLERETLSAVDAVVATAKSLVATKLAPSGRGFQLPQGVNYDHFAHARAVPEDIATIPRPRIGFAGQLGLDCDLELLRVLAIAHPEWSVVLVGGVDVDTTRLALPNVHILGHRPYTLLPAYVQAFDVGIIPYVLNSWTRAVDPLKTLEYLAAGLPVVSLPIPEITKYSPPVRIARGHVAFVEAVAAALAEPTCAAAERRAVAREHTWERRAEQLMSIVQELKTACAPRA